MPNKPEIKFVDSAAFKALVKKGEDTANVAVLKSSPVEAVEKAPEADTRALRFILSTPDLDRDKDTIASKGWALDFYQKNPVVLFAHDHNSPPIAQALATYVEGNQLKSVARFAERDLSEFADMIYRMLEQGFIRATSVGFMPIKYEIPEDRERGLDFFEQELMEWSVVPVPANPKALLEARAKGINTQPLRQWAEKVLDEWDESQGGLIVPRKTIEAVYRESDEKGQTVIPVAKDGEPEKPEDPTPETPAPKEEPTPIPDEAPATEKSGRVLSKRNEGRIQKAIQELQAVLDELEGEEDSKEITPPTQKAEEPKPAAKQPAPVIDKSAIESAVREAVRAEISALTGKVY